MMWTVVLIICVLLGAVFLYFKVPYSPTKVQFNNMINERISITATNAGFFTEVEIADLPLPVQKYFHYCGYLGTPKMLYMKASLVSVDFVMPDGKKIKIDYKQANFVTKPERFAYISFSKHGMPFEGLDSFVDGKGSLKGISAKDMVMFNQQGKKIDQACLVTWLAESMMFPNAVLQDFLTWEYVDDTHVKASISWQGITAEGIFTFDENGELKYFRTKDRVATDMGGSERIAEWSAAYSEYHLVDGILQPKVIQSIWHHPEGDCVYFNENKAPVSISFK